MGKKENSKKKSKNYTRKKHQFTINWKAFPGEEPMSQFPHSPPNYPTISSQNI